MHSALGIVHKKPKLMDRNQATGIMLILLLLFVYFQFFAPSPQPKQVFKNPPGAKMRLPTGNLPIIRQYFRIRCGMIQ
jgi:hypothetical protein